MMRKVLIGATLLAATLIPVNAQVIPNPGQIGIACAYNSSVPTPTSGQFFLVQCDSTGKLLTSSTGGTSPNGSFGSTLPSTGTAVGGLATSSEPTAATTGAMVAPQADLSGKLVTSPYSIREKMLRGSASSASNTAVSLIAAQGASVKTYITNVQCGRTDAGTTAVYVTLSDANSTILVLPNNGGGGGNNVAFNIPLVTAANTAFTFTPSASTTTIYCSAQGFAGY